MEIENNGVVVSRGLPFQITVVVGTPALIQTTQPRYALPPEITLIVAPGGGGTVTCEYRGSELGGWYPVSIGTAGVVSTAETVKIAEKVQALRFTAATANGTVDVTV